MVQSPLVHPEATSTAPASPLDPLKARRLARWHRAHVQVGLKDGLHSSTPGTSSTSSTSSMIQEMLGRLDPKSRATEGQSNLGSTEVQKKCTTLDVIFAGRSVSRNTVHMGLTYELIQH